MALPLSEVAGNTLNVTTSSVGICPSSYAGTVASTLPHDGVDIPSSPFVENVLRSENCENLSPIKPLALSGKTILKESIAPFKTRTIQTADRRERSPRKLSSPEKRFPIKVSTLPNPPPANHSQSPPADSTTRKAVDSNKSFEILEDNNMEHEIEEVDGSDTVMLSMEDTEQNHFADDTAFSTFSAVPDMTMFSKIRMSPVKPIMESETYMDDESKTPVRTYEDQEDYLHASPTPRQVHMSNDACNDKGDTTNLILDFTEQFNCLTSSANANASPRRRNWSPPKNQYTAGRFPDADNSRTPYRRRLYPDTQSSISKMSNLLDFDLPPAPTPRSIPTVTPRELETLKSELLSQISSLKASLSGKEAEIMSLKTAIDDAEKRAGESLEKLRDEQIAREQLAADQQAWEKRGREMEQLLRTVKEEIVHGQREREALEGRLDESEKRREAAEIMAQEAESRAAGIRAGSISLSDSRAESSRSHDESTSREVELAVEKVARELHTLYKGKHETKVAALKKSYENRWDRKVKDLEARVDELSKENEELKIGRDVTMSGVVPRLPASENTEELRLQLEKETQAARALEGRLQALSEDINTVRQDNSQLRYDLEQERLEKGELVAACDELLALQEAAQTSHPSVTSGVENLRGSISRASGLRAPNFANAGAATSTDTKIGKIDRTRRGSAQGTRPGSGLGMRSGIMSSIEKMGSYKGRSE
jgi:hypothetical protein